MRNTGATRTLRHWGAALAAAATATLGLTGVADANVYEVTTGQEVVDAVLAANANPGFDQILLHDHVISPPRNLTITDDLLISGDHKHDAVLEGTYEGPGLSGDSVDVRQANFITVNSGVRLILSGIELHFAAVSPFNAILNNGYLQFDNSFVWANNGRPIHSDEPSSVTIVNNTTFAENTMIGPTISTQGVLRVRNSTFMDNFGGGIQAMGPVFELRNSVFREGPSPVAACYQNPTAGSGNRTTDGTCGNDTVGDPGLDYLFFWTGPTQEYPPLPGGPLIGAGDPAYCPAVDQAFYVRPTGSCDIGAVQSGAVRDTTPPECGVTATRRGPDEQDVTLSDSGSGIGYDGVFSSQIDITNGSVAYTGLPALGQTDPFANPPGYTSRPGNVLLTAVKETLGQTTSWGFTARDFAGNVRVCE